MTDKIRLLVDDLSDNKIIGICTTISKVSYNLNKIEGLSNVIAEMLGKSEKGGMTICFPTGRYICIYQGNNDPSKQRMIFIDFRADIMHAHFTYIDLISEETVGAFRRLSSEMVIFFDESFDTFELSDLPNPTSSYN